MGILDALETMKWSGIIISRFLARFQNLRSDLKFKNLFSNLKFHDFHV